MTGATSTPCPAPETLAAFAEGHLHGAEAAAVVAHIDTCDECMRDVALAMQAVEEEARADGNDNVVRPRRWLPWLAAAAAALIVVTGIWNLRPRSATDRLVALAPRSARVVEPRLTGGFAWSPYRGTDRSSGAAPNAEQMKLAGAAGELIERAERDGSAQAQHDAGVAMVLTQNAAEAMARLERAAAAQPSAKAWSDLAAARYAAASDLGRAALYPQALAAADAALRLEPRLAEALFNRALILDRMGLFDEARAAWTRYLAVDPSSKWAEEARSRLAELPAAKRSSELDRIRPRLEEAATRGDAQAVRTLLAGDGARARAFAETEFLGSWGEGFLQKKDAEAARSLAIARAIGSALATDSNETLLRDAVQSIDAASPSNRESLASAHAAYRAGRIAYSRHDVVQATSELTRAATLFAQTRSPMELAARFYLASIRQMTNEGGAAELQRCLAAADAHPGYRALGAYIRWELGRARMFDYDWPDAAAILAAGASAFREAGDRTNEAFVEVMLAYCLAAEGRGDDAWSSHIRSFRALSAEGNAARLVAAINSAMLAETLAGRGDAALALAQIPRPAAAGADMTQTLLLLDTLQYKSLLESTLGRSSDALDTARNAAALARQLPDASLRARRLADADVLLGAATASSDPAAAAVALTRAVDFYRRADVAVALPEALLLRARCALRTGGTDAAARDLEEGMTIVERHRDRVAGAAGAGILNADQALFTEAMRMHLERNENAAAFAIAERSRGMQITLPELQARLRGSATAVLELVVLPGAMASFVVTEDDVRVARREVRGSALATLADASLAESGTEAAAALYEQLVRPVDGVLAGVRHLIVVPDPLLQRVPFAALFDGTTRTYLVEHVSVAVASSAASLQRNAGATSTSVATIALPAGGETGMAALPQAERELTEIAAFYRRATTIAPADATLSSLRDALGAADVVHVAGHTERQRAGGEHALLLAGQERASSRSVAMSSVPNARLLVLAACETLRPPASNDTRALSLGAAFVAAGVPDVIGTLTPVGDRDARSFFRGLHRHLASEVTPAAALRAAQIDALRQQTGDSRAWRSIALLTRRINTGGEP